MAQYGDPQNSDFSRFRRYTPGSEPSSRESAPNGGSVNGDPSNGQTTSGYSASSRYQSNPLGQPGEQGGTPSSASYYPPGQDDLNAGSYDSSWSQGLSGIARKRNQWRQFQTLKPDFGDTQPVDPLPPSPPPRVASLPTFKSARQSAAATPTARGTTQGARAPQPSQPADGGPKSSSSSPHYLQSPNRPHSRPNPGSGARLNTWPSQPSLQPHPHSTALPEPSYRTRRSVPGSMVTETGAQVTPLNPQGRSHDKPSPSQAIVSPVQPGMNPVAGAAAGSSLRSRPSAKPRRRLPKAPLPLLYLIRLIILGVGVAAIAGTLLSVLSPSNLASSSGENEPNREAALTATGSLVTGTTATGVSDIVLGQELTRLKAEVEQLGTLTPGLTQTAFMVDLDTGDYVDIAGAEAIAAASTIKVPVLVAFLQEVDAGNIALNQGLVMEEAQVAGGSGTMQNDPVGSRYTALDVATQMIITSDNTATNMMIDALGGIEVLNQRFQAWGLNATVLRNPLPDLDGTNTTSTRDLALLMALVDQGGLLTPRSRDRMFSIMQRTVNQSLIPFGISDESIIVNKTGDISTVLGDVALVDAPNGKRYAIATLVERPENDGRASELIRRTAETTHNEFRQPIAPVGGTDPSSPEDAVPAPANPEVETAPSPPTPEDDVLNREQIPQG